MAFAWLYGDTVVGLCEEIGNGNWLKEEVAPTPRSVGALVEKKSDDAKKGHGRRR